MDRLRIHKKIRSQIQGTKDKPRLSVFRSNKHICAQLIDDEKGVTICSVSDRGIKKGKQTKSERARAVGVEIAKKSKMTGVGKIVFDRGGFRYHGRIKCVAEGAREGGLIF